MLKNLFRKFRNVRSGASTNDGDLPQILPDTEVQLIKAGLERKFGHPFQIKVKVDGYLDNMEYRLIMNDYHVSGLEKSHSVWGAMTTDVLDLKKAFVSEYWDNLQRAKKKLAETANLSDFDRNIASDILDTAIADSREELLRAAAEGAL